MRLAEPYLVLVEHGLADVIQTLAQKGVHWAKVLLSELESFLMLPSRQFRLSFATQTATHARVRIAQLHLDLATLNFEGR